MLTNSQVVTLHKVTANNVRSICELAVKKEQRIYVVSNALAIAEACFAKNTWFRSIYMNKTPVGLAVLELDPEKSKYFLWRFMVDAKYQKQGIGKKAIELLIAYVKTIPNATEFLTSIVLGEHSPQKFYETLGFEITDELYAGETIMRLRL